MIKLLSLFSSGIPVAQIPYHCGHLFVNIPFKIWHPDLNELFHMHIELRDYFSFYSVHWALVFGNTEGPQ